MLLDIGCKAVCAFSIFSSRFVAANVFLIFSRFSLGESDDRYMDADNVASRRLKGTEQVSKR
jgi:hypothetical protein